MSANHRQATSKVLGRIIKYRNDKQKTPYPPNANIDEILHRLSVTIGYHKAWRAREEALKLVRGSPLDSFMHLRAFFERLKQVNPSTVTDVQTDSIGHFKYCFMALGVSIRGFVSCICPVLAIDGTHLRGKCPGTLLLACGLDGNNQIYPLAFGIIDSENDESWEYFLNQIHGVIGNLPDLAFISDQHNSIASALEKVFPDAHHGICIQHLNRNVVANFKSVNVSPLIFCAAKSYNEGDFGHLMTEIWRISHEMHHYITVEGKTWQWARVHFPGRGYSIMMTNIAESLNVVLTDVRDYLIVPLLDAILMKLIAWFTKRRAKAVNMQGLLTTWADKRVEARGRVARRMQVQALDRFTYYVFDGDRNPTVDLRAKTCTCRVF